MQQPKCGEKACPYPPADGSALCRHHAKLRGDERKPLASPEDDALARARAYLLGQAPPTW